MSVQTCQHLGPLGSDGIRPAGHVGDARPEPPVRGEWLLDSVDRVFQWINRRVERAVPAALNPFAQTGAIANVTFFVALASGVILLLWYSTSIHTAYSSLEAMRSAPLTAQLVRSLHRYSSDACMLFVLLHAVQLLAARRFGGARWLAWVTGVLLVGMLWLDGWLGYWLVWDARAAEIARGTARLVDVLPVFVDPLARSFLVDAHVNSLLFFVVFFIHMLIPCAMAAALLVHILRLNRARFLPDRAMAGLVLVTLVAASLLWPATSAAPARMLAMADRFPLDAFYMLPLLLTDRLGGGLLWLMLLLGGGAVVGVPWLLVMRRAAVPVVTESKCNGCTRCYHDCPYNAIQMVPRGEGVPALSVIDPAKCVGCGICVGSCNPTAIVYAGLEVADVWRRLDRWFGRDGKPSADAVAFVCANAAGAELAVEEGSGRCDALPGYRVVPVPCSGWVNAHMVERAIRRGAAGVLVAGCASSDPFYRLGGLWTEQRLEGEREPVLRQEKVEAARVRWTQFDRTQKAAFVQAAGEFRSGVAPTAVSSGALRRVATVLLVLSGLLAATLGAGRAPYAAPTSADSELVVSIKLPGQLLVPQAAPTPTDAPNYMQGGAKGVSASRARCPVRLQVSVDGAVALDRAYPPRGLFKDGNCIAVERLPMPLGPHAVTVRLADTPDAAKWTHEASHTLAFDVQARHVVLFDKLEGFGWY